MLLDSQGGAVFERMIVDAMRMKPNRPVRSPVVHKGARPR